MAEMTEAEFLQRTSRAKPVEEVAAAAAAAPPSSAAAAFAQRRNAEDLSRLAPGTPTLRQELGEEGRVPLDIDSGLGANVEFELARRPREEDKLRWLAAAYGPDKIRLNKKGEPIVRIKNAQGQDRDILVNARGLTPDDLGALVAHVPELAGAMLGRKAFGALSKALLGGEGALAIEAKGAVAFLAKALASAAGGQAAGAAQDVAVRSGEGVPLEPLEIFERRGTSTLTDVALQGAMGVGIKGVSVLEQIERTGQVPSPVKLMRGPIQEEAVASAGRIQQRTGLPMSMSPGQSTGNPFVAAAEQYLETNPAGAGPQLAGRARREAERAALQDWFVDPATLPLDEEIGRRGIGVLTTLAEGSDAALLAAKTRVQREGQSAIKDLLTQRFNKSKAPDPMIIGGTVRDSAFELREAFQAERGARWEALYGHPKAAQLRLDLTPVSQTSKDLLRVWPKDPQTGELITGFGPEGLLSRIQKAAEISQPQAIQTGMLGKTVPATMPLDELHNLRILLDQQINGGQAITGIKDQKLISLRGSITQAIEQGVKKDPQLEALWRAANDYTKENSPRFQNKNIATLFRDPEQGAFVGDEEFIRQVSNNGDKYLAVRDFFGRSSDEARLINRNIADSMLRKSANTPGGDDISAEALRKELAQLYERSQKTFYGVFGKRADVMLGELNSMEAAGTLKGSLSAREFVRALDPETASRPSIQALLQSQLDNEAIYSNNVIKRFVKGELPATALQGEEFINWTSKADLTDVKEVMGLLRVQDPALAKQHTRRQIQKFFADSSRQPVPSDVLHDLQGGTGTLPSGVAMFKQLGNKDAQAKLEEVVGKDNFSLLKDYIKVELSEDEKKRLAAGTGIMTRGSAISAILRAVFSPQSAGLSEVKDWAKVKTLSYIMADEKMASWLAAGYKSDDIPDLFRVIISSEPFVAAVAEDLKGDSRAFELISTLKHAGFGGRQESQPQRSQLPTMTEGEFLQRTVPRQP